MHLAIEVILDDGLWNHVSLRTGFSSDAAENGA